MKIKAIGLVALGAVMALVSCQKETVNVNESVMDVTIDLANISLATKSSGGTRIESETAITLGSCQIFFTDGVSLFPAKDLQGNTLAADGYYYKATEADPDITDTYHFHLLPSVVTQVIVVGNRDKITAKNYSELNARLEIDKEQNAENLSLYGVSNLVAGGKKTHEDGTVVPLYTATVNLKPRIARFFIKSLACTFSEPALYDSIQDMAMAFNYYWRYETLIGGVTEESYTQILGTSTAWDWFSELAALTSTSADAWKMWTYDDLTKEYAADGQTALALTPATNSIAVTDLYYHFFIGDKKHVPQLALRAVGKKGTDPSVPLFLNTMRFVDKDGKEITTFQEGYIYEMDFNFSDTHFNNPDKCIDVIVDVQNWKVVPVTPVFGDASAASE